MIVRVLFLFRMIGHLFHDPGSVPSFPLPLSFAVSILLFTKVIVSALGLPLMLQRGGCLTHRLEF